MKSKQKLQAAASELFLKKGYENTTVQEIAHAAGLTERTFFRQFKDKSDVLFDSENTLGNQVAAYISANIDQEKNPVQLTIDGFAILDIFDKNRVRTLMRSQIIASHSDLRERELLKSQTIVLSVQTALSPKFDAEIAALAAAVALQIFHLAFTAFLEDDTQTFKEHLFRCYAQYKTLSQM